MLLIVAGFLLLTAACILLVSRANIGRRVLIQVTDEDRLSMVLANAIVTSRSMPGLELTVIVCGPGIVALRRNAPMRGEIDKLILLSPMPIEHPEQLKAGSILYIASRDESLATTVRQQFALAPQPKQLVLLDGSAHAQNIFATTQAQHLGDVIVQFITGKPNL